MSARAAAVALIAAAPIAAACTSDDRASAPPARTMPRGLEVCADITGEDDPVIEDCLDAIEFELAAGTAAWAGADEPTRDDFDRAIADVRGYSRALEVSSAFQRSQLPGDDGDESTDPIRTWFQIGVFERTLWTCFVGESVSVSTAEY